MFRQHTRSKRAQQDMFDATLVGATGPYGSYGSQIYPKLAPHSHYGRSTLLEDLTLFSLEEKIAPKNSVRPMSCKLAIFGQFGCRCHVGG